MPHSLSPTVLYARLMAKARLRHLQLLVMVADQGSLKRAAAEMGLSQPAATQALAELEQLLERPLFERHAKGMRLTAGGRTLIPVIRNVLGALQQSTESLAALQEAASGLIRVGTISAVASAVLGERVIRFCERHPDVRVEIVEDTGAHLVQSMLAGTLNLVLCRRPLPLPAKLHFEPVRPDEAVVVAGVGHPLVGRTALTLGDLADYPWMRAPRGVWIREVFDALFERAALLPRLHPVSTATLAPLPEILRDNRSVALIPLSLSRTLCRWQLAVALDVQLGAPRGEIGMLCPLEAMEDPLHLEFASALRTP